MKNNYTIPDDLHPEVQKTMTEKTIEVPLPRKVYNHLQIQSMQERADTVQKGYNLMDHDHMTLMGRLKTEKTVHSPWKRFKKYVKNKFRLYAQPPKPFRNDPETLEMPFKFKQVKAVTSTFEEVTGIQEKYVMQTIILKALNQDTDHWCGNNLKAQIHVLKERTGVETDGEAGNVDEMQTDYSSEEHVIGGGEE